LTKLDENPKTLKNMFSLVRNMHQWGVRSRFCEDLN